MHVFVQVCVLHAYKFTHYWCSEAAYYPPAHPATSKDVSFPIHDAESRDGVGR